LSPRPPTLLLLLLAVATGVPSAASALSLERPPYLQLGTPNSVVVRWRTDTPSESMLRYGPAPGQLTTVIHPPGTRTEHEVAIQGLSPQTVYYYSVGTSTETLAGGDADHYFRTSPPKGGSSNFRIWVIGDSGTADATAAAVRDAYRNFARNDPADVWLMLGDNAYSSGEDAEYTEAVFQMYPRILRNTLLWPSPGNHDMGSAESATQSGPYFEGFTLPKQGEAGGVASGTEAYYSFDYGNVHFVALDSEDSPKDVGGPMHSWLELDLQANDKDFVIAYWHHPPYSKGSHNSDKRNSDMAKMRRNFVSLLEDYGVDLQLSGHSHSYERSMLIDGHYDVSRKFDSSHTVDGGDGDPIGDGGYHKPSAGPAPHEGAVYSVVGSSGKSSGGRLNHPVMVRSILDEGSLLLEVEGRSLRAWWINKDGSVRDHYQITKGPRPECSDEVDNDGDGLVDFPVDPGCIQPDTHLESPECNDAIDNDGDGAVDLADAECDGRAWWRNEADQWSCGLGFESALILVPWSWLRGRRSDPLAGEIARSG
jgi:hypothetical protein